MARLTFLGTSDAFHSGGRMHSAYLIESQGATLAVDFGATALLGLKRAGVDPRRVAAVAVTHLHGDHVAGLPFLVLDGMYSSRRTERLEIVGPPGTAARLDALFSAAYDDLRDDPRPFELAVREVAPGASASAAGFRIATFAASHMSAPHRPLMLRVHAPDGAVAAFTGDTEWTDDLVACASGARVLVAECTGMAPPIGRHMTWDAWRAKLPLVGARRVVFSHLGADVRAAWDRIRAEAPAGVDLSIADDGLALEI